MLEQAHDAILNRDESRKHVQDHLSRDIAYLTDLVNYGTNLIIRTLGPGGEDVSKLVVCGGLLKHVVGMMDAAVVLLESGHSATAFPQARSAFEASLYIGLILKKQSELRARTYLVGEYRRQRTFAMSVLEDSDAPGSFNAKFASIGMNTADLDPQARELAKQRIVEINEALKCSPLDRIDQIYQSKRRNKKNDPAWYQCLGLDSLFHIARDLNQVPGYELWYSQGSSIVHADSFAQQVVVRGGNGALKPIRNLEAADQICGAIGQVALKTYRIILEYYRPLELPAFREKYLTDWQASFRSPKKINYLFQ